MKQTFSLSFKGYQKKEELPEKSGIYLVYQLIQNPFLSIPQRKLVYIGESDNMKTRQEEHYNNGDYPTNVKLEFSCAVINNEDDRKRCEAALIYHKKPEWNKMNTKTFNYDQTTICSEGEHYDVPEKFTVNRYTSNFLGLNNG